MKKYLTPYYTFTPGASGVGTIDTNITNFDIKLLTAIINVTKESIIYSPVLSGRGYTSISGGIITLEFDTSTQSSSDIIQILYQSTQDYPVDVSAQRSDDLLAQIQRLTKIAESLQVVDSAQRQRVALDTIAAGVTLPTVTTVTGVTTVTTVTTVSTVTTVASVTNVASNAGMDREQYINIAKQTYAQSIRSRLTIQ